MDTLIKNCNLVNLETESCEIVSLIISDGKIEKIENSIKNNRTDLFTIDLKNKYIMPGLWDVHTHIGDLIPDPNNLLETETLPEYTIRAGRNAIDGLKKGITSLRILGEDGDVCLAWKKIFKKKGFLGPNIYTARRAISATGGHGHGTLGSYEISGPYEMRKAVRENIAKGADLIKIMVSGGIMTENEGMQDSQLTDDEINAAVELSSNKGLIVSAHAWGTEGIKKALKCGVRSIEHGLLDDECVDLMLEKNAFYVPTICQTQDLETILESGLPQFMVDKALSVKEVHLEGFKKAYKAGVKIACGSDSPPLSQFTHLELKHLNIAGMSTVDTLKSGTTIPAELCGVSNTFGKIEENYIADIIVLDDNPLNNLNTIFDPIMVFKNGIKFDEQYGLASFEDIYIN
jgi:imidazolonepropionase-like amidohydrolase|tara:strand:- start:6412 stop:7620 length:1209 start_codon:yes stop_codon:yes gene_type:complete